MKRLSNVFSKFNMFYKLCLKRYLTKQNNNINIQRNRINYEK